MKTTLQKTSRFLALTSIVLVFFTSCVDDKYDIDKSSSQMQLTPGVAVPLAHTSFSLGDILEKIDPKSILKVADGVTPLYNGTKLLKKGDFYIEYNDNLYSLKAADLIKIPDQNLPEQIIPNDKDLTLPPIPSKLTFSKTFSINLNLSNGARFDSILIKTGNLKVDLSTALTNDVSIDYTFNSIKKNNKPYSKTINLPASTKGSSNSSIMTLDGYTLTPDNKTGTNAITVSVNVSITNKTTTTLKKGDIANLKISLSNLAYSKAVGYAGVYDILNQSGSISIGVFNNAFLNSIQLENPEFTIVAKNSFGAGMDLILSNVYITTSKGKQNVTFNSNPYFPITVKNADIKNIGKSVETKIKLDPSNTNMFDLLHDNASLLNYTFKASTKNAPSGTGTDFVLDTSKLDLSIKFYAPVAFKTLGNLPQPDTMDVDFTGMKNSLDKINSVQILLDVTNGLPIDVNLDSIFVADELWGNKFKLFEKIKIKASTKTGTSDNYTSTENKDIPSVALTNTIGKNQNSSNIDKLKLSKHLIIFTSINTPSSGSYQQLSVSQKMTMYFKIKAEAKIDLK